MVTWRFRVPLLPVRFRLPHPLEVIALSWHLLRQLLCVLLTVSLLILFSFPANAAVTDGVMSGTFTRYGSSTASGTSLSWGQSQTGKFYPDGHAESGTQISFTYGTACRMSSIVKSDLTDVFGSITIVFSYYAEAVAGKAATWSYGSKYDVPGGYKSYYRDDNNVEHAGGSVSVRTFTPVSASGSVSRSTGLTLETSTFADEIHYLTTFRIAPAATVSSRSDPIAFMISNTGQTNDRTNIYIKCTSARCIVTASSGDTEALKEIADAVIAGNQILSAMYGDILAVCNQIYQRTGSILETQRLANQYLTAIRDYLQSLDTTTDAIYALLGAKFDLLISTLQTESDDIQAAIDKAVQDMIAYLDAVFSGSVGQLPSVGDSLQDKSDALENQESQWQGSMTDNFNALQMGTFAFPSGVVSGLGFVAALFTQLWDKLGTYAVIYTFPLYLGLVLMAIGRLPRSSNHSSFKEDKKK